MTDVDRRSHAADLVALWREHAPDDSGAFHLALSREWEPVDPRHKMPAMVGRQVFGFSTAYLLTGEPANLELARRGVDYLLDRAWDEEYGGWYDRLTRTGEPAETIKSVPLQLYTNVGLVQYYLVTGEERALAKARRSMKIHRTHGRDEEYGGHYQQLARDLSVADDGKNKHAHYGYVGSLTLNASLATRDESLLNWQRELCDLSLDRLTDSEGWIYGFDSEFDRQWVMTPATVDGERVRSVGAQLTAALAFLRLSDQTGADRYLNAGLEIADTLYRDAWDERGFFPDRLVGDPGRPPDDASVTRWVHSYACFLALHCYRLTDEQRYLDRFEAAERFYRAHFLDGEYGGVFPSVAPDGTPTDTRKARPWKTSYHELEHELLVDLYHTLYVDENPVDLHFRLDGGDGRTHYVSPVDDPDVRVAGVTVDGEPHDRFDASDRSVTLPPADNLDVTVTLAPPTGR
jgi:mannose/cellobiose epimerase-like protein (N-acyl-D-glucosamine 2-epimerase family)